jgi:plasmid maintenance system antidote protein VapI
MRMQNPPHPGEIIRALCLEPVGLTVTEAAEGLGVSRKMAIRLSIAFNTSAESWLSQQVQYDLWHAEQGRKALKVVKLAA